MNGILPLNSFHISSFFSKPFQIEIDSTAPLMAAGTMNNEQFFSLALSGRRCRDDDDDDDGDDHNDNGSSHASGASLIKW